MTHTDEDMEATSGPAAPDSEHKRSDHITSTTAEGLRLSGTMVWVQAATDAIPMKCVVARMMAAFSIAAYLGM